MSHLIKIYTVFKFSYFPSLVVKELYDSKLQLGKADTDIVTKKFTFCIEKKKLL